MIITITIMIILIVIHMMYIIQVRYYHLMHAYKDTSCELAATEWAIQITR